MGAEGRHTLAIDMDAGGVEFVTKFKNYEANAQGTRTRVRRSNRERATRIGYPAWALPLAVDVNFHASGETAIRKRSFDCSCLLIFSGQSETRGCTQVKFDPR